jgi:hypothetical protein
VTNIIKLGCNLDQVKIIIELGFMEKVKKPDQGG